ncbi:MAG: glutathione S-transferase family protein [Rhodospirillales bacterium]|nr:glutathione S-transferase family protein [Rhodospirillales bacterium]
MIKLWGRNTSSNVMKVIWLLEELGIAYDRVDVGGAFGGTATAAYRTMQPLGLVPAIEDGDFHLFESNTILRYICNAHAPSTPLYPTEPMARARVEAWMDFQQTAINRPMSTVFIGLVRTAPEQRDLAAIAAAAKDAAGYWAILDGRLAGQTHVASNEFSLADIALGIYAHRWFVMDVPGRPEAPHLRAWYQRLLARPVFARHIAHPPT